MMGSMTITAAADGSALGNPGPTGWAWYVDDRCWAAGGWAHGTNNQGELMAVLDLFRSTAHVGHEPLHVLCDSQYVINAVTKWMPGWKRKGWRKGDGKPVANLELFKEIDDALSGRDYRFEWVRGHTGHPLNEAADERARAVATAYQAGAEIPTGPGFCAGDRDEPDLFSELTAADDLPAAVSDEQAVVAGEQRLLDPQIDSDMGALAILLHPDYYEVGSSGRIWDRDTKIASFDGVGLDRTRMEQINTDRVGQDSMLLSYRGVVADTSIMTTSLWVNDDGKWRLRYRQGTPEA